MKGQFPSKDTQFSKDRQPVKNGRPKGKALTTILKEMLECEAPDIVTKNEYIQAYIEKHANGRKITHKEMIMLKLIHSAESIGDMRAIIEVLDRTDGKVKTETDITSGGEKLNPIAFVIKEKGKNV